MLYSEIIFTHPVLAEHLPFGHTVHKLAHRQVSRRLVELNARLLGRHLKCTAMAAVSPEAAVYNENIAEGLLRGAAVRRCHYFTQIGNLSCSVLSCLERKNSGSNKIRTDLV
jgi:hypothetical protein